ncbi:FAD:protein FMN transferase [Kineosporia rhizophila]|uniref:FAD:protein FMN transferase n=1 Tax=Kineosporia TaxID=49184 RepID=UPI001E5B207E|nr:MULTISPECIES: FAD:protein FMN transferase [Kineosporia]MCE0534028.1 FAD:protein FMN transferase [Kineosporia rhizophila]GLY13568.1 FAD:protein FMN transferase [Kineosporia sp. NBRC 101677]
MPLLETLPVLPTVRQWPVWSTTVRIVVTDPEFADRAAALVAEQLAEVDQACSRFRDDSELAQVQRARTSQGVTVSALLAVLLGAALEAAEKTDGDVDPTLADDLAALGYTEDYSVIQARAGDVIVPITLSRRRRPSWRDVSLTGRELRMPEGMRLDLGATAKAWAADRAARTIAARFGVGVLVSLGGDIATAGPAPAEGWQVLVKDGSDEPAAQVGLDEPTAGLATSSTVSRTWRNGTRAVHHILNPASGLPAEPVWRTVSVAAGSCLDANIYSTAAIVRGEDAPQWLRELGHPARLVAADGTVVTLNGWPREEILAVDAEPTHEIRLPAVPGRAA